MKPFKCDLCNEELDSRRQAFKHFDKVHGGAGTVSSCSPSEAADQIGTTTSLESASQHFLIVPNDGPEGPGDQPHDSGDLVYESDSEVKVKEEFMEDEEGLIIPDDLEGEDLAGVDVPEPPTPNLERDPLSQPDSEEESEHHTRIPTKQMNSKKAVKRNSIEDIAKNIIVRKPSKLETNLNGEICPKCMMRFKTPKDMQSHYRLAHLHRYQCSLCLRKFTCRGNILKHVCIPNFPDSKESSQVAEHQRRRPKKQLTNKTSSSGLRKTLSNNRKGKRPRSFKCKLCVEQFPNIPKYQRHYENIHLKVRFSCEFCNKSFTERSSLIRHERREHPPETQDKPKDSADSDCLCDLCKLGYNCASMLKERKPVHLKEGEFPCDVCGTRFNTDVELRRHRMKMHPPGLRFFCEDGCGESFVFRRKLILHQESCPIYKRELPSHAS